MYLYYSCKTGERTADQENVSRRSLDIDHAGNSSCSWVYPGQPESEARSSIANAPPRNEPRSDRQNEADMQSRAFEYDRKLGEWSNRRRLRIDPGRFLKWTADKKGNEIERNEVKHDCAYHFENVEPVSQLGGNCRPQRTSEHADDQRGDNREGPESASQFQAHSSRCTSTDQQLSFGADV